MARSSRTEHGRQAAPRDHYQAVTDRIVAALEAGTAPWRRPWITGARTTMPGMPCNAISGRAYRGVNAMLLSMTQIAHASNDPRWMTYRQASQRGWQVRAGECGTPVVFFKRLEARDGASDGEEGDNNAAVRRIPMLRGFTVFHASQVQDIPDYQAPTLDEAPWRKPEAPELIVAASGVPVRVGGDRAYYVPAYDFIGMPPAAAFRTAEGYAATLLHELGHASGAKSRLDRDLSGRFGSHDYAFEELVADLTSCFVGSALALPCEIENHASYLQSWLDVLKADKRAVFKAAAAAQKAADWMLGLHPDYAGASPDADDGGEARGADATHTVTARAA